MLEASILLIIALLGFSYIGYMISSGPKDKLDTKVEKVKEIKEVNFDKLNLGDENNKNFNEIISLISKYSDKEVLILKSYLKELENNFNSAKEKTKIILRFTNYLANISNASSEKIILILENFLLPDQVKTYLIGKPEYMKSRYKKYYIIKNLISDKSSKNMHSINAKLISVLQNTKDINQARNDANGFISLIEKTLNLTVKELETIKIYINSMLLDVDKEEQTKYSKNRDLLYDNVLKEIPNNILEYDFIESELKKIKDYPSNLEENKKSGNEIFKILKKYNLNNLEIIKNKLILFVGDKKIDPNENNVLNNNTNSGEIINNTDLNNTTGTQSLDTNQTSSGSIEEVKNLYDEILNLIPNTDKNYTDMKSFLDEMNNKTIDLEKRKETAKKLIILIDISNTITNQNKQKIKDNISDFFIE